MKYLPLIILPFFFLACGGGAGNNNNTIVQAFDGQSSASWYQPDVDTTWQWQLNSNVNTSYAVDVYDIDLFDTDVSVIDELHQRGKKVICYFSAGSYENWRPDKDAFPAEVLGNSLEGWAGEKWLDITSGSLEAIMLNRLDLAREKGCDAVEPDNIDGYTNNTGFALSANDQLAYNRFLAREAHARGLSIGLKNDLEQIIDLEPYFDFAINERCNQYNECDRLAPFTQNNKAVFNAEYNQAYVDNTDNKRDLLCTNALNAQLQTLVLPLALDDTFRISCN